MKLLYDTYPPVFSLIEYPTIQGERFIMKGTAILFQPNQKVTIIEDVDHSVYEKIKEQCGCEHCNCKMENKVVDFGTVSPVLWNDEVDWAYGY